MQIAICCEQVAPSELMRDALTIGQILTERGHKVAYVTGDPIGLVDSAGEWTLNELYQAPMRRAGPTLVMKQPAPDGFADVMANLGFDEKQTLITLATLWNRLFDIIKPNAIVGFCAPIVWLTGPSRAPTFALGSGFMLPPVLNTSFPRLSANSAPLAEEEMMLKNANAVLLHLKQPALATLSEVIERCTPLLYGVPAFDPYLQVRRHVSMGLLGHEPTPMVPPVEGRLVAFLDVYCPGIETLVLALAAFKEVPIDVCITGATTNMRRFMEQQAHIRVWKDYATLLVQIATASAVVHHGVQDVAQRCMSFGRPQFVLPWTAEQGIYNATSQWMGFSYTKSPMISIDEMVGSLRALMRDSSIVVAAQHHARQLADSNLPDAIPEIIQRVESAGAALS